VTTALSPLARKFYGRGFRAGLGAPLDPRTDSLGGCYCHPWVLPGRGLSEKGWGVIVGAPPCALKPSLTFQEVCDLLGCKIADFAPPRRGLVIYGSFLSPKGPPNRDEAYALRREQYTCWVWLPDPEPPDLGKAVVCVAVEVYE
jgi:hypothetical protein